jgi:hypothetical protein
MRSRWLYNLINHTHRKEKFMAKLHELLAAEKTPTGAWNQLYEDTLKKFKNVSHFFDGHSKSLSMIEDSPANQNIEDMAREEKPVTTTVFDTLEYALQIFGRAEDLQFQKNATNRVATGTVMWRGKELLAGLPVDELMGLEARITKLRALYAEIPTLDATKHWELAAAVGAHIYVTKYAEETTKTEKQVVPVVMSPATEKHPAQVQAIQRDAVVGKFTTVKRSGAATSSQKAEALKLIDELLVEVKQARTRANDTEVVKGSVAAILVPLLLEPLKQS